MRLYSFPEVIYGSTPGTAPSAVAVAQSLTDSVISNEFGLSAKDALNGRVDIKLATTVVATGMTAKLQTYSAASSAWIDAKTATITNASTFSTITWNIEVSGDQTHLPLRNMGRVVITTGAGDSTSVVSVRVSQFS